VGEQLALEKQEPTALLLAKRVALLRRVRFGLIDEGVKDQAVLLHDQDGFAAKQLEARVFNRADRLEPLLQSSDQRFVRTVGKSQQPQRLDPVMALHRAKIAALTQAFERQHQL